MESGVSSKSCAATTGRVFYWAIGGQPENFNNSTTSAGNEGRCVRKRGWMNIKNSRDRGAWAELCFAVRAMEEGLRPARPWGEPSGYDSVVHHKSRRLFRVQVKSTIYKNHTGYNCTIKTQNHVYKKDSF